MGTFFAIMMKLVKLVQEIAVSVLIELGLLVMKMLLVLQDIVFTIFVGKLTLIVVMIFVMKGKVVRHVQRIVILGKLGGFNF